MHPRQNPGYAYVCTTWFLLNPVTTLYLRSLLLVHQPWYPLSENHKSFLSDVHGMNLASLAKSLLHFHLLWHAKVRHLYCHHPLLHFTYSFSLSFRAKDLALFKTLSTIDLPDWFHWLSGRLTFVFCSTAGLVCMALSRFWNALKIFEYHIAS